MRCTRFVVALIVSALVAPAMGDILHLTDGSKVEGTLKRERGGWSLTDANGKTTIVPDEKVESVQKVSNLTPADAAASKVASQRRAVEALSDLNVIIERWTKFIDQNKDTPAAEEGKNWRCGRSGRTRGWSRLAISG